MQLRLPFLLKHTAITAVSISVAIFAWALFARYFAFPDLVPSPWRPSERERSYSQVEPY